MSEATVTVTREIAALPERVFDAWLDPKDAAEFLFATAEGEIVRCDIDPRVGGRFFIVDGARTAMPNIMANMSRSSGRAGSSSCSAGPGPRKGSGRP